MRGGPGDRRGGGGRGTRTITHGGRGKTPAVQLNCCYVCVSNTCIVSEWHRVPAVLLTVYA
jgi:hypothetical protein